MAVGTTEIKGGIISKAAGKIDYGILKNCTRKWEASVMDLRTVSQKSCFYHNSTWRQTRQIQNSPVSLICPAHSCFGLWDAYHWGGVVSLEFPSALL